MGKALWKVPGSAFSSANNCIAGDSFISGRGCCSQQLNADSMKCLRMNSLSLGMFSSVAGQGSWVGGSGVFRLFGLPQLSDLSGSTSLHLLRLWMLSEEPTSGKLSPIIPKPLHAAFDKNIYISADIALLVRPSGGDCDEQTSDQLQSLTIGHGEELLPGDPEPVHQVHA